MSAPGRFITLEGGEGAGKSTQCKLLADALIEQGAEVIVTHEPGGTAGAQAIRELVLTGDGDRWDAVGEALLMYAARRDHVLRLIKPTLVRGAWVICDRFSDSTMAYQGYAKRLGRGWVDELDTLVLSGFKPDLTFILDLPAETGLTRATARGGLDRFENMGVELHEALRAAFLKIAASDPARIVVVDATGSVDTVHEAILSAVEDRFRAVGVAIP